MKNVFFLTSNLPSQCLFLPSPLHPTPNSNGNQILERKRERRREERRVLLFFMVIWFKFHRIYMKEFVQRSPSSRSRRRDLDPRMRREIYKVLAHRWSRCSDQIALCGYQQRSGACAATIRTRDIRRIRGMEIWSPFIFSSGSFFYFRFHIMVIYLYQVSYYDF